MPRIYTVQQVAEYLQISDEAVYRLVRAGVLKAFRPTKKDWRITESAIEEYINNQIGECK